MTAKEQDSLEADPTSLRAANTCSIHSLRSALQFDVYDDLSMSYTDADRLDPAKARPTLGGSREWPYPRRLRTGGAKRQHAGGKVLYALPWGWVMLCRHVVLSGGQSCSGLDRPALSAACQQFGELSKLHTRWQCSGQVLMAQILLA